MKAWKGRGLVNSWLRKSWKKCVGKNEKLSHYAHLRNTNLIKRGSMMIFAVDGRVQSHDIFLALRGVMQESIWRVGGCTKNGQRARFFVPSHPLYWAKKRISPIWESSIGVNNFCVPRAFNIDRSHIMEGKNKFNTYVVSFDYPSSYSSVLLRLRS